MTTAAITAHPGSLSWEQFHEVMGTPAAARLAVEYGMLRKPGG